jgi:hypothetical protein
VSSGSNHGVLEHNLQAIEDRKRSWVSQQIMHHSQTDLETKSLYIVVRVYLRNIPAKRSFVPFKHTSTLRIAVQLQAVPEPTPKEERTRVKNAVQHSHSHSHCGGMEEVSIHSHNFNSSSALKIAVHLWWIRDT